MAGKQLSLLKSWKSFQISLDPLSLFYEIYPLTNEVNDMFDVIPANLDDVSSFTTHSIDDFEEECECKGERLNNIFEKLK